MADVRGPAAVVHEEPHGRQRHNIALLEEVGEVEHDVRVASLQDEPADLDVPVEGDRDRLAVQHGPRDAGGVSPLGPRGVDLEVRARVVTGNLCGSDQIDAAVTSREVGGHGAGLRLRLLLSRRGRHSHRPVRDRLGCGLGGRLRLESVVGRGLGRRLERDLRLDVICRRDRWARLDSLDAAGRVLVAGLRLLGTGRDRRVLRLRLLGTGGDRRVLIRDELLGSGRDGRVLIRGQLVGGRRGDRGDHHHGGRSDRSAEPSRGAKSVPHGDLPVRC